MSIQISKKELAKQTMPNGIQYFVILEFRSEEYKLSVASHGPIPQELDSEGVLSVDVNIDEIEVTADELPSIIEYEIDLGVLNLGEFEVEIVAHGKKKKIKSKRTKSTTAQEVHRPY